MKLEWPDDDTKVISFEKVHTGQVDGGSLSNGNTLSQPK